VLRSVMRGSIPPLPHTPSWRGAQIKHRDSFYLLPSDVFFSVIENLGLWVCGCVCACGGGICLLGACNKRRLRGIVMERALC